MVNYNNRYIDENIPKTEILGTYLSDKDEEVSGNKGIDRDNQIDNY